MTLFRKKPVVIEAMQLTPSTVVMCIVFIGKSNATNTVVAANNPHLEIRTLEGTMKASCGDWIIKGINGEFYPCKPDIFEKTYEAVTNG